MNPWGSKDEYDTIIVLMRHSIFLFCVVFMVLSTLGFPLNEQLWDIYIIGFYSAVKKKNILPFARVSMDLEDIMLSETSQSEKDKCCMISYVESNG